jgi:hypothetical protein
VTDVNQSAHEQRGMCRHCSISLHRAPGTTLWLDPFNGEECASAPLRDGDPGRHNPTTILNKPDDPPPTGPGPIPVVPLIPRMTPW